MRRYNMPSMRPSRASLNEKQVAVLRGYRQDADVTTGDPASHRVSSRNLTHIALMRRGMLSCVDGNLDSDLVEYAITQAGRDYLKSLDEQTSEVHYASK